MKSCSILISSWCGHKATELCIESILKRTNYNPYKIIVCDSSPEDSKERKYLRKQRDKGNIELLENKGRISHEKALNKLLSYCKTELACMLDSDNEVLDGNWLKILANKIQNNKDLGVGYLLQGDNRPNQSFFFAPEFHPSCIFLNMSIYKEIRDKNDWHAMKITMKDYKQKSKLHEMDSQEINYWFKNCNLNRTTVEYDVGGIFAEKIMWRNPKKFKMYSLPLNFFIDKIKHYGGMSAYSTRLDSSHMLPKMIILKKQLQLLRKTAKRRK